jgi:hypothetical protein
MFLPRSLIAVLLSVVLVRDTIGQSTAASVSGTVYDQQRGVLPGAALTLKNHETGQVRSTVSDGTGNFRLLGIAPGAHVLEVELAGFAKHLSEVTLSISQDAEINPIMKLAQVGEQVTVVAQPALAAYSTTTLGRTFDTKDIEELPVAARDFASLAVLTPGILTNHNARGVVTGIATASQNGRNNTFLIDGLTLDDHVFATTRGTLSLDAIKEFMVLSNHFTAEYGQASGAVVSVLTRSGTNRSSGRGFYFHRDDDWDATRGAAKLTIPPADKSKLEQKVVGGFLGGPIKLNRAFYFGSIEHTMRDTESIVTSGLQHVFRPGAPTRLPVEARSSQVLARSDVNLRQRNMLTLRYRFERATLTNQTSDPGPVGLISAERRQDEGRRDQDLAVVDNHVIGSTALNEFRFQFARREITTDVTGYCAGCWAENRPGILLGKSSVVPSPRTEDRWQFANAMTYLVADKLGDHALKAGVDVNFVAIDAMRTAGHDGIFTFDTNAPFDPTVADTYPTRYFRSEGDLFVDSSSRVYTAFFQDQWKPVPRVTLNLGVRWDYEEAIGVARDRDNVAPRMGIAFDPSKDGRTSIRGGYGLFYDLVLFNALISAESGAHVVQTIIRSPGYPDPFGPNPRVVAGSPRDPPSTQRFGDRTRTPYTEQASFGVRHMRGRLAITADAVWARGGNLLRTRNINLPDSAGNRLDPSYLRINLRETEGHSWYKGLQVGIQKSHSRRHSFAIAYTLSDSQRDTEDWDFIAQDARDFAAERGPSLNDVRHRLSASVNLDLPFGLRFTTLMTGRSALPYNITTGRDNNGDNEMTDRPSGVGRNSARGDDLWQIDMRLAKAFDFGQRRSLELLVEAFNFANHRNWTAFDGNQRNTATFGRPTDAGIAREIQVGVRVNF